MAHKKEAMRLLALPLTRARPNAPSLVYYHAQLPKKPPATTQAGRLIKRATEKVIDVWTLWGKAESGWKHKVHAFGEKAQSRIDFEELALKSIDPALGPKPTSSGLGAQEVEEVKRGVPISIPLLHPTSFTSITQQSTTQHLRALLAHREPTHKRWFYIYLIASPFTAPFMIVPVIPNIPFFFCAWRAWGNFRAWKAASYLISLINHHVLAPTPSAMLDTIYAQSATRHAKIPIDVLLDKASVPRIVSAFGLSPEAGPELLHALAQANIRAAKASEQHKSKEDKDDD